MRRVLSAAFFVGIVFLFPIFADRQMYIQNPSAKLLTEPRMNAPGAPLTRGQRVTQTGEQGMFFAIRSDEGSGFVPKLYTSAFAPGETVRISGPLERDSGVRARARASNFSQTAAARGLSESQSIRTRGNLDEYDFASVDWLETIKTSPAKQEEFRNEAEAE